MDEKQELIRYYEQMKQSILENSNYVDALMETAEAVYTVDLTNDCLENAFYHVKRESIIDRPGDAMLLRCLLQRTESEGDRRYAGKLPDHGFLGKTAETLPGRR